MFVKPGTCTRRGVQLQVRDPRTKRVLSAEGREVPDHSFFWLRRLRDGDVVAATRPASAAAPVSPANPDSTEQKGQ